MSFIQNSIKAYLDVVEAQHKKNNEQKKQSVEALEKEIEKLILGEQVIHNSNPVMNWMLSNIAIQEDPAGNLKPNKAKSKDKIDGIVALVMALGEYMTEESVDSVYDQRGLLIL